MTLQSNLNHHMDPGFFSQRQEDKYQGSRPKYFTLTLSSPDKTPDGLYF